MSIEPGVAAAAVPSVRYRFRIGLMFNLIGAVFNQGSTFALNIIAAHLLGKLIFGEYAMVQSTIVSLTILAQFAIPYTTTKYVAEFRSTDPVRTGRILGVLSMFSFAIAAIASLALLFLSPWIAASILKTPLLHTALSIASIVLFTTALNGFLSGALAGLESYRRLAGALAWSGVSYLIVCTFLTWLKGLNGAIFGLALSGIIQLILLAASLRTECLLQGIKTLYHGFVQEQRIILKFALPAGLIGFTAGPALWLPMAFLIRQPNGYSQVAIYSASFSLMAVVLFLPSIANTVGMSIINHYKGGGDKAAYRQIFWINLTVTAFIIICGAGLFALLGPNLLGLFGKSFKEGYTVLALLLLSTIPQGLALALSQVIQSHGKLWLFLFAVAVPRDALVIVLGYCLIPLYGAAGLASAYAIGWTVALLATLSVVFRLGINLRPGNVNLGRDSSY